MRPQFPTCHHRLTLSTVIIHHICRYWHHPRIGDPIPLPIY